MSHKLVQPVTVVLVRFDNRLVSNVLSSKEAITCVVFNDKALSFLTVTSNSIAIRPTAVDD